MLGGTTWPQSNVLPALSMTGRRRTPTPGARVARETMLLSRRSHASLERYSRESWKAQAEQWLRALPGSCAMLLPPSPATSAPHRRRLDAPGWRGHEQRMMSATRCGCLGGICATALSLSQTFPSKQRLSDAHFSLFGSCRRDDLEVGGRHPGTGWLSCLGRG